MSRHTTYLGSKIPTSLCDDFNKYVNAQYVYLMDAKSANDGLEQAKYIGNGFNSYILIVFEKGLANMKTHNCIFLALTDNRNVILNQKLVADVTNGSFTSASCLNFTGKCDCFYVKADSAHTILPGRSLSPSEPHNKKILPGRSLAPSEPHNNDNQLLSPGLIIVYIFIVIGIVIFFKKV